MNNCSLTNRLCIEQNALGIGKNKVFFPINLIPLGQQSMVSFRLQLRSGVPSVCTQDYLMEFTVIPERMNQYVWFAYIELPANVPKYNQYHLALKQVSTDYCIYGPDLFGTFTESVRIQFPTELETTVSNAGTTSPTSEVPESNVYVNFSTILGLLIVLAMLGMGMIGLIIYRIKKYRPSTPRSIHSQAVPVTTESEISGKTVVINPAPLDFDNEDPYLNFESEEAEFFSCESESVLSVSLERSFKSFTSSGSFFTVRSMTSNFGENIASDDDSDDVSNIWGDDNSRTSISTIRKFNIKMPRV
jgi:hypothetical protein